MPADGQQLDLDDVAEGSPFVRLLETKSRVKMLDVFLRHSYAEFTEEELAERAAVNQSTVNRNIDVFRDIGVVEQVDRWPAKFRVDLEHPVIQGLEQAQLHLLGDADRLRASDVHKREDQDEWMAVDDLSEEEIRRLIDNLQSLITRPDYEADPVEEFDLERCSPVANQA